ncbi:glycoside hydrolase family 9 [Aetokthonos hydrillicola CCALA 1050]|nr:glycoside hydrolase family 9 [Aetokthonos hydrillicola CCALA 1050]
MIRYALKVLLTAIAAVIFVNHGCAASMQPYSYIMVDQFGYRPQDTKIAVIADPQAGFNAHKGITPSHTLIVKNIKTNRTVFSGVPSVWNNGETHKQSGDKAWWFDFSKVTTPGSYVIVDPKKNTQSPSFKIQDEVYKTPLKVATKMFFYQRSGFAKKPPYANACWTDTPGFMKPRQDTEARLVTDKNNPATARNVSGGWMDAGDTNKYVTFAEPVVHQLLTAYQENPSIWTDDFNIPESGNHFPDLLDEVKFELEWLKKMQDKDGGVFIKVGTLDFKDAASPGKDTRPRYYAPKCSSSTIATSGMFAHASLVLGKFPQLQSYSYDLAQRARSAWKWFRNNPINTNCDTQEIKSGDADRKPEEQIGSGVVAAIYLSMLDKQQEYTDYIRQNINQLSAFHDDTWSQYQSHQGDALLQYTRFKNGDAEIKNKIISTFTEKIKNNPQAYGDTKDGETDPYRAYMPNEQYHWGSNLVKANIGNTNFDAALYKVNPSQTRSYETRALDHLHYLHGVNPFGIVYLSNMYKYGASYSVNRYYHAWFGQKVFDKAPGDRRCGPAPGYVPGGPNKNYTGSISIDKNLPMKAYVDENNTSKTPANANIWELTEPAIYYQSAYVKLLSHLIK